MAVIVVGCELIRDEITSIPSDIERESQFNQHRGDFERLVRMSDEDNKALRIAFDFTWVQGEKMSGEMGGDRPIGFSDERWSEYKTLFKNLKLESGLTRSQTGSLILLSADTRGLVTGGFEKGYMFSRERKVCEHESLDDLEVLKSKNFACITLDGPWSLYISR